MTTSLKVSLARRLVLGLLVLGCVGAAAAYAVATRFANQAYDRSLFDDVQVLANQVRRVQDSTQIALSPDALLWLLADEGDAVIYRVTDLGNHRVLTSNGNLGPLPDLDIHVNEPYFRSLKLGTDELRIAYVIRTVGASNASALVEIGETTRKRDVIARSILVGTVSIVSVFILVAVALVWSGIGMALKPLQALEADAARRSIGDLQPLDPSAAPAEVRGLIDAINHMIGRVVHAIDLQRQFLANAAHQLKTPIAGLRLQAQMALKAEPEGPAAESLRIVEQRATHSAHLIDQLLTLARAEAADEVLPATDCDIASVARDVIERLLSQAIARRIDLGFDGDGLPSTIVANPLLIGELISNLVDNALRYGRAGGQVTVSLRRVDDALLLGVEDDGDGIPPSRHEAVFRRFSQADTNHSGGAGLGLAIVREIATHYGGSVTIGTNTDTAGARIVVRLPVRAA